ncbi:MAG TPA: GMC family oxidoreductase [Acidimicrobiia bacterium]|jgi:gluconate 2-dehydrogenase alpha chain
MDCDAVIVGSGPAGATAADVLTGAGWSVIMLEKGRNHLLELTAPFAPIGHISNDEIKFVRRHFLGPDPWLEPRTFRRYEGDEPHVGEVNNLPSTVGGGGFHADAKLPRFREDDFKPLTVAGPVEAADLVDWPLDYDEMEPYYAQAEKLVGVAGEAGANPFASWRADPYPMPPGPDMFCATLTAAAAERLGMHPYRAPTGVNSVEYDGRPACNNCGFCGHYGCPIDAKGDPVAPLRRALRTGKLEIRPESYVSDIVLDGSGRQARGVRYIDSSFQTHEISARFVVLGAGAFETPRLLLRNELGNPDVVGRFLQYHFQTFVVGIFPYRLHGHRGRAVTHLMDDPIVPDDAAMKAAREADLPFIRGGIVEHGAASHPIMEATIAPPGMRHSQTMLSSPMRDRMAAFTMQGEDLPLASNRIDLDPRVTDVYGRPAGRVTYRSHAHEIVCAQHWGPRLEDVMRDAGAERTFWASAPPIPGSRGDRLGARAPISRHIVGSARMGDDPATSVFDRWQRMHGLDNIVCTDSSVFPTSAGYGPTLTIVALAIRASRALADLPPLRSQRPPT